MRVVKYVLLAATLTSFGASAFSKSEDLEFSEEILAEGEILHTSLHGTRYEILVRYDERIYLCQVYDMTEVYTTPMPHILTRCISTEKP